MLRTCANLGAGVRYRFVRKLVRVAGLGRRASLGGEAMVSLRTKRWIAALPFVVTPPCVLFLFVRGWDHWEAKPVGPPAQRYDLRCPTLDDVSAWSSKKADQSPEAVDYRTLREAEQGLRYTEDDIGVESQDLRACADGS